MNPLSFLNGITRQEEEGIPPDGWVLASDGWWYPPEVTPLGNDTNIAYIPVDDIPTPFLPNNQYRFTIPIVFKIINAQTEPPPPPPPQTGEVRIPIRILVSPAIIKFAPVTETVETFLDINPIPFPIADAMKYVIAQKLNNKIENFFDQDRVLKTLLNFGTDFQSLITNWKQDTSDPTKTSIILKLYEPLPTDVLEKFQVYISRELAYPLLEQINIVFVPGEGIKLYLRPPNKNIKLAGISGNSINNVTFETLFSSGAFDVVRPQDRTVEEWFTTDLEGVELHIDYSNYSNFVFFGSAQDRLTAFTEKLKLLEGFDKVIYANSQSLASIAGSITASLAYPTIYNIAQQRQDVIRSFDGYERFLYYSTAIPFSGTFAREAIRDEHDQWYFHSDVTWPKISGSVIPVLSASKAGYVNETMSPSPPTSASNGSWLENQLWLAKEYDQFNVNSFKNNIPEYLKIDDASQDFIKFLGLTGHMFDTIKLYIDNMSSIYDRNSNPAVGMSPDVVWNVAKSLGVDLPNPYSIKNILDYTIGSGSSDKVYKEFAEETWKRFLHNQIYLLKSKGTKTALQGLLNSYGVLPTTIQIRETSTPALFYSSQSYETYEEITNVLDMQSGSFIQLPFSGSGIPAPSGFQVRFSSNFTTQSILLNGGNRWGLALIPNNQTSSYGSAVFYSGSTAILTSDTFEAFGGDFFTVTVQKSGSFLEMFVKKADRDFITTNIHTASSLGVNILSSSATAYLGSSGSSISGQPFRGYIDEFRLWNETLEESTLDLHAKYPGLYNGNTFTSARDNLLIRLSFNKPKNLGTPVTVNQFVSNESPYIRVNNNALLTQFSASGFDNEQNYPYSMEILNRDVLRYSPNIGGTQYDNNKIVIEPEPILKYISGSSVPVLNRFKSIVDLDTKKEWRKSNNVIGFFFSPTDAINDSIIRSIGNINLHSYIGDPMYHFSSSYKELDSLNDYYWNNYSYTYNINRFIDFVKTLLSPIFEQAERLVPVRSKLLSGIVIEPHILDRAKIPLKPLQTDRVDFNVEEQAIKFIPTGSAELDDLSVVLNSDEIRTFVSEQLDKAAVVTQNQLTIEASSNLYSAEFQPSSSVLTVAYNNYFDSISLGNIRTSAKVGVERGISSGTIPPHEYYNLSIEPLCNFRDIDTFTYFTDPNGLVGTLEYEYRRIKENVMVNQGTWSYGTVYTANDFVNQNVADNVNAVNGNGKEYYAIKPTFTSNIPPSLDTEHWRPMGLVPELVKKIGMAVWLTASADRTFNPPSIFNDTEQTDQFVSVIPMTYPLWGDVDNDGQITMNDAEQIVRYGIGLPISNLEAMLERGDVNDDGLINVGDAQQIVRYTLGLPTPSSPKIGTFITESSTPYSTLGTKKDYIPVRGYSPKHYVFFRPRETPYKRARYLGCVQTTSTTTDGLAPVQILDAADDAIIVNNNAQPIIQDRDVSGPILDIN